MWDNIVGVVSIGVSSIVAFWIYKLSKQLSAKTKFEHEKEITEEIRKISLFSRVILADVKKYKPFHNDYSNQNYYKQGAELFSIIAGVGVQFILMPSDKENIPCGLVPFDWIEYTREHDSEDNKPIIVCKFKGVKWYKPFKSPFKEMYPIYLNKSYEEGYDPKFMMYTRIKQ